MKSISLVIIFSLNLLSLGYTQSDPAVDYFDFLNQQHNEVVRQNLTFTQYSVHSDDFGLVEMMRGDVIKKIQSTRQVIKKRKAFEGGLDMRNELVKVLDIYFESFHHDFDEISILKKKSKDSYEALEAYFEAEDALEEKLAVAANKFLAAQKVYAPEHNIKLSSAGENKVIQQINEVNNYTRIIYMKEFRVSKANAYFFDALEKEDVDQMEKTRASLVAIAKEELKHLAKMEGFKADKRYLEAARNLIQYYLDLGEKQYIDLVGITHKSKEVGLNQSDVDAFNKIIQDLNGNSSDLVDAFNETMNFLLKNNVPKPEEETQRL